MRLINLIRRRWLDGRHGGAGEGQGSSARPLLSFPLFFSNQ
eukprot:COSAG06_NODE_72278_length_173_cov_21.743243_1_plen_40_part_10